MTAALALQVILLGIASGAITALSILALSEYARGR